jgi:hypothetical protein
MLRSLKALRDYALSATDGEIGKVITSYIDDQTWSIRYFVVETGTWLNHREVLIAPLALGIPDWDAKHIPVLLTQEQVKNSPPIDVEKPVSRQMEEQLSSHYGWAPYWEVGLTPFGTGAVDVAQMLESRQKDEEGVQEHPANTHLRSTREVIGYEIHAKDGNLGYLNDLIVDDQMWPVRYLVVALDKRQVLISPHWVSNVDWSLKRVSLDLDKMSIKLGPDFDPKAPVNREYEVRLYDYYGRPKYWVRV